MAPKVIQKNEPNTSLATAIHTVADEFDCERLLNRLSQLVPSGMFFVDADKVIRFWNRSAERISGLRAEDVVGKKCTEALECRSLEGYCPLDLPYVQEAIVDQACIFKIVKETTSVLKSISVLDDQYGRRVGAIEYFTDVERQSITESALEAAAQVIRSTRQAKDEFISNVNHEIRTPINGILGLLDLLMDTAGDDIQLEHLGLARGAADNLLKIVDHLLDFSVIEKGNLGFDVKVFNLDGLVESLTDHYNGLPASKSINLRVNIDGQVPRLLSGDSNRLFQIVKNLIDNAIKATTEGTIELSVGPSPKTDLLKCSNPNKLYLRFTVQDTGCGIPEDKMAHVFREFSQTDASHTRALGGLGLGLHMTWRLIKMQGGDLNISSKVGKGTLLEFDLPFSIIDKPEATPIAKKVPELNSSYWMEQLESLQFEIDKEDGDLEDKLGRLQKLALDQDEGLMADYFFRIQLADRKKDKAGCLRLIGKLRHSLTHTNPSMMMMMN